MVIIKGQKIERFEKILVSLWNMIEFLQNQKRFK